MSDRRRGNKLQGYRYMLYLVVLVISHITGIDMTACTDRTKVDNFNHVVPMCKGGGPLYNEQIVIDTWDTGGPDVYSCTCTVTLNRVMSQSGVTTVTVQEYPRVEPWFSCGSKLRITSTTSQGFTETGCTPIPATTADNFGTTDELTLTLSRANNNTPWQSGHCIFISSDVSDRSDVAVTCLPGERRTTQLTTVTTTSIPTTQSSTADLTVTTTSGWTTTPTPSKDTTTASQTREITTYAIPDCGSTTRRREECPQQQGYSLSAVLVPLAVTILLIIVSVVGHVIFYRRRLALVKQPGNTAGGTTPQSPTYDSLDLSRVESPNVYADTSNGQIYVNAAHTV